jgi:hypothetical protein
MFQGWRQIQAQQTKVSGKTHWSPWVDKQTRQYVGNHHHSILVLPAPLGIPLQPF